MIREWLLKFLKSWEDCPVCQARGWVMVRVIGYGFQRITCPECKGYSIHRTPKDDQ